MFLCAVVEALCLFKNMLQNTQLNRKMAWQISVNLSNILSCTSNNCAVKCFFSSEQSFNGPVWMMAFAKKNKIKTKLFCFLKVGCVKFLGKPDNINISPLVVIFRVTVLKVGKPNNLYCIWSSQIVHSGPLRDNVVILVCGVMFSLRPV